MALSVQLYSQLLTTGEQAGNDEPGKSLPLFSLSLSEHVVFESDSFMSIDCIVDHQCGSLCFMLPDTKTTYAYPYSWPMSRENLIGHNNTIMAYHRWSA